MANTSNNGSADAATPRPWLLEMFYGTSVHGSACVAYITGRTSGQPTNIADVVESYNMTREEAEANAALICRAVNSHADLVAALEKALNVIEVNRERIGYVKGSLNDKDVKFATSVLSKAKE